MSIRELLADKIMNWETDEDTGRWIIKSGLLGKSYWNPESDIGDAWGLLEQFEEGLVRKRLGGLNYRAWVLKDGKEYSEFGDTPSKAIVNVMLKYLKVNEKV